MEPTIRKILERLQQTPCLAVAAHQNPEGDALGATLAVALWLRKKGGDARAYNVDPVPGFLRFLPGADTITRRVEDLGDPPLVVVVDCGEISRTGKAFEKFVQGREIINLDHHDTNNGFGRLNLVRPQASSASEIVYDLITAEGEPVAPAVAWNLYTGILMDTGSFRFPNTTPAALRIASELVAAGVDPARVARETFDTQPAGKLKLLARVLSTMEFDPGPGLAGVVEMVLTQAMFTETGTQAEDAEGLINHPVSVESVKVAVLYRQLTSEKWKVSLRSRVPNDGRPGINIAKVAEALTGGGHRLAAGATVAGSLDQVRRLVHEKLAPALAAEQ